jgi:hypothetical protein
MKKLWLREWMVPRAAESNSVYFSTKWRIFRISLVDSHVK